MNPGNLDCRIEIGNLETVRDPDTKIEKSQFVPFRTCWAEKIESKGLNDAVWFNIRPAKGIKRNMHVHYTQNGEQYKYEIEVVKPGTREKGLMSLQCKEVV